MQITELSDVDVWVQLTLSDIDACDPSERLQASFAQDTLIDEINRRWSNDALERVAQVITTGHFSPDDELRWLRESPMTFLKIVTGETTYQQWLAQ